ncbi:uncharacterized protein LOC136084588 [Hydra vulgaris]|uniref:Uncharacterized protein LOC136084588 n=1 Tax=Hydra vulgaris TaxID=6087 RepID=A0ABM4CGN2_HYDVU
MLQYHGGTVFGKAVNNPNVLANTVLSFMVITLFGGPKFLCKMLPVCDIDSNFLFEQTNFLLSAIKVAGGHVISIVCDGNRVNQAFFKKFETDGVPWRTKDYIYLLYDFVHLLKNIRNIWITEKSQELEFFVNKEKKVAKWSHIVALHKLESNQMIKMSKLTDVAVFPKPIERQKVSTCLKVFCEETVCALKCHLELKDVDDTISFLSIITEFWRIDNVHSLYADVHMRVPNRSAIFSSDDFNLQKLLEFGNMAKQMCSSQIVRFKSFTKDTSKSIYHTCNGLVELSKFLLSASHEYVLLGTFTTDPLEKQFGKLRQGSGGTYFITVQQILEKVGIIKTKLLLQLDKYGVDLDFTTSGHSCERCGFYLNEEKCLIFDNLPELENILSINVKITLIYIAGFVVRNDKDSDDSYFYYEKFRDLTEEINRGGLTIPGDLVCQWVIYCYIMFREVADNTCISSLCNLMMLVSESYQLKMNRNHGVTLSNVFFKNYCNFIVTIVKFSKV